MIFSARYVDARGRVMQESLRAESAQALHADLSERGGLLLEAEEALSAPGAAPAGLSSRRLLRILDSLRTALSAAVPVHEALAAIEQQVTDPSTKAVVSELRRDVEVGEPLHRAMAQQSAVFDPRIVAMVAAGERSNSLDQVLAQIVSALEWRRDLRAHTIRALTYPVVVLAATGGLFAFLLLHLLPSLAGLVEQSDSVPDLARSVVRLSLWMEDRLWIVAVAIVSALYGAWESVRTPVRRGRLVDRVLRLPVFRSVGDAFDRLRLCRTLQTLLSSGIPFTTAFDLSSGAVQSSEIRNACRAAHEELLQGERPGQVFSDNALLDPLACSAVSVADRAGRLEEVFDSLGRSLERDVRERIAKAVALIEPAVTIGLGALVGAIAALVISTLYGSMGGIAG